MSAQAPFTFNPKPSGLGNTMGMPMTQTQKLMARQNSGESLFTSAGSEKYQRAESQLNFDDPLGGYGNFKPITNTGIQPNTGMQMNNANSSYAQSPSGFSTQSNYGPTSNLYFAGMNNNSGSPGKFNQFSPQSSNSPGSTYSTPNFTSSNPFKATSTQPIPLSSNLNSNPLVPMTPMNYNNSMTSGAPQVMGTGLYQANNVNLGNQTQPRMMMNMNQPAPNDNNNSYTTFPSTNPYQNQFN